jgi:hypothetical protein
VALNFVGAGVTVTDDAANLRTVVTITGGGGGAGTPPYISLIGDQTLLNVTGAHCDATPALLVMVYDNSVPRNAIDASGRLMEPLMTW